MHSVTIGVTTYNRKSILEKMAKSLYLSDLSVAEVHVRVYDDCSKEFDQAYLEDLFPGASVKVNKTNLKADLNTYNMYKDFLESDDEYFFNGDADLIFRKDWLSFCLDNIEKTQGVMSIFNTQTHSAVSESKDSTFVIKSDIGAAGTFFKRERIEGIVKALSALGKNKIDWGFSQYFLNFNVAIYCSKESYVQHIGLNGQNSSLNAIDYADNFKIDSVENGQIVNDILNDFLKEVTSRFQSSLKMSKFYKFGYYVLYPVVLYKRHKAKRNQAKAKRLAELSDFT
ncbi:MAG: glycosyltransferase [Treponema sp.]|nr:glycosyltransferase [Treponema sp.]